MSDRNHVTLVGNALDPKSFDFREGTSRKKAYLRFGMRVNDSYVVSGSGERVELDTIFIDIKAFGQQAENIHASLEKSTPITVTGRLEQYPRAVIFLGEDNREELKDARNDNEDIAPEDFEFSKDDKVGYVTVTNIVADNVSVGLGYAVAELEYNERDEKKSSKKSRSRRKSSDEDDEGEDEPKKARRTRSASSRKRKADDEDSADEAEDNGEEAGEDEGEDKPKARRSRAKTSTRKRKPKSDDDDAPSSDDNF